MRDVAERAGVSPATVSRVLNNGPSVDPALVDRVLAAVRELGYQPNRIARNLRRRIGSVWALIISDIENPFFTALARGVEDLALQEGFSLILCNTDENLEKEKRYVDVVLAEQAAGVIIAPASEKSDITALTDRGVPVVTVDRRIDGLDVDGVLVDNHDGAAQATTHLLEAGYRRVACITGPAYLTTGAERLRGYENALRRAGCPLEDQLIRRTDFRVEGGYAAAGELLDLPEPPDALFVANNLMAAGALRALRERGVDVPGTVGVVGFDDLPWAPLMAPALTTVAQPSYDVGREAAKLLLRRLADRDAPVTVTTVRTELRVRESSAGPR